MSVGVPSGSRATSPRVRQARTALLDAGANARLDTVRELLCEPTRTQIVRILEFGPLQVGDIATILDRSKSATSQHLRVLREAGVVVARRRGRTVLYSLSPDPMVQAARGLIDTAASMAAAPASA